MAILRAGIVPALASALACVVALGAAVSSAHGQPAAPADANPGRDLTLSKCFQCHTQAMWVDQRQDERAWRATLYRMVGRGAAWSGEDIRTMAAYLATDYGPGVPRAKPASK